MDAQEYQTERQKFQKSFKPRLFGMKEVTNEFGFPEIKVTVPDSWKSIVLAPFYDVHVGNDAFDEAKFLRHRDWMVKTPNVLSWLGGDIFENITPAVAKMGHTHLSPHEQLNKAADLLGPVQHKMLFGIPGNHEDRTHQSAHVDSAQILVNEILQLPYSPDYMFLVINWRGNRFRILAHHGAGGATTPGAQRNAARKELPWVHPDILWTGHLHQPMVDIIFNTDYDPEGTLYERDTVVLISPSYLKYFGTYSAKHRMAPGIRGLSVAELQPDGRIDINVHANGRRL